MGAMGHEPGHDYDSFVVRLWRDAVTRALLRAEIEHVQTGRVDCSVGSSWEWIQERLDARLDRHGVHEGNS